MSVSQKRMTKGISPVPTQSPTTSTMRQSSYPTRSKCSPAMCAAPALLTWPPFSYSVQTGPLLSTE
jgi:hypothetical protein